MLATPEFHHWHHTSDEEGIDKNFAVFLPFIDVIFGTAHHAGALAEALRHREVPAAGELPRPARLSVPAPRGADALRLISMPILTLKTVSAPRRYRRTLSTGIIGIPAKPVVLQALTRGSACP